MAFWAPKKLQTTFNVGTILHQRKVVNTTAIELQIKEVLLHVQENNVNFLKDKSIHDLFSQQNIQDDLLLILKALDENKINLQDMPKDCQFKDSKEIALFLVLKNKDNDTYLKDSLKYFVKKIDTKNISYKKLAILGKTPIRIVQYLMFRWYDIINAILEYDESLMQRMLENFEKYIWLWGEKDQNNTLHQYNKLTGEKFLQFLEMLNHKSE